MESKEAEEAGARFRNTPRARTGIKESRQEGWQGGGLVAPGPIYAGE